MRETVAGRPAEGGGGDDGGLVSAPGGGDDDGGDEPVAVAVEMPPLRPPRMGHDAPEGDEEDEATIGSSGPRCARRRIEEASMVAEARDAAADDGDGDGRRRERHHQPPGAPACICRRPGAFNHLVPRLPA
jgi:hypothetical protein